MKGLKAISDNYLLHLGQSYHILLLGISDKE